MRTHLAPYLEHLVMSSPLPEQDSGNPFSSPATGSEKVEIVAEDAAGQAVVARLQELRQRGRNGANWFFWVAGLSLVNSVIMLSGGDTYFVIGLGVTLIADAIAREVGQQQPDIAQIVKGVFFGFDVIVAVVVIGFGWLAVRRYQVVYALGMILYLLDGLLFVLAQDWFSAGFHAFALFCMWTGFSAYRQLNAAEQALQGYDLEVVRTSEPGSA
jgi:hypothetical protein